MMRSTMRQSLLLKGKKNHQQPSIAFFFFCIHLMAYYLYVHNKVIWTFETEKKTNTEESSLLFGVMGELSIANFHGVAAATTTTRRELSETESRRGAVTDQLSLSTPLNRMYSFTYPKSFLERIKIHNNQEQQFGQPSTTTTKDVQVVYGVLSRPNQQKRRNAIRNTWGDSHHVIFVVASSLPPNEEISNNTTVDVVQQITQVNLLQEEFDMYGDILILNDVTENYRTTLVPKTFVLIYWFGQHILPMLVSSSATSFYLFKTDDDVYVNTTFISQELRTPRKGDGLAKDYFGRAHIRTKPERYKGAKHYLSRKEYPNQYFPNYAEGVGYGLSSKFVNCATSLMLHSSSASEGEGKISDFPPPSTTAKVKVPWEDVATGVLAKRCGIRLTMSNYSPQDQHYHNSTLIYFPFERYKNGGIRNITLQHGVKPEWMVRLHNQEPLH